MATCGGLVLLQLLMVIARHVQARIVDNRTEMQRDKEWWWSTDYDWDLETSKGLFPSVFNLAANAIISVNATCGETEPETYCKLVEHVLMREPQCGLCNARSENPEHRHPITNAIDGTDRWWQSPTLQNGKHFEWVTVTLDLRQIFQVAYVIVKAAVSPRPGNWILERSRDGLNYKPWQFYALSDAECWEAYGIRPTVGQPRYRSDDEVICTSYYSKLNPLEGGEIHTSLVNGRPGVDGPSDTLRQFTTTRYVRLRMQKIRTLNADLMTLQTDDRQKIDKSTTRRYFYSIKDISIGGQCVCFGHAKDCPLDPETNLLRCKCEHNTCGENCEQCCPLYQQNPWRSGTNNDGAVCKKCQCFGHAEICFYDQTVADKKASLNIDGEYEGGGVCIKCKHHTMGINCEQCEEGYYRPLGVERDDSDPCRRCRCAGPGVTGFCVKDDSYLNEGLYPGDCLCKEGFAGSKCDHCAIGYKNYPNCEPCPCYPAGTEGGTTCEGQCICKKNVEGQRCDICKHGYYNLHAENPDGCSPCYCSDITNICQPSDWGVEIIHSLRDWQVSDIYGLHVADPVISENMLRITNDDMLGFDSYYWMAPPEYLGKKLYSYGGELRYVLGYSIIGSDDPGEQNNAPGFILEGDNTRIGYYFGSRQIQGNVSVVLPLHERGWSFLTAAGKRSRAVPRAAFVAVMNNITRFLIQAKYHSDQVEGVLYSVEMEIAKRESSSIKKMSSVEKCDCPLSYAGLSCEVCEPGYRRINNTLHGGICERCECNNHAASCDAFTSNCKDCQHNTAGLHCEYCEPGFHGNPKAGTPEDCKPCACPLDNPENNFSPTCEDVILEDGSNNYICTVCAEGYEGDKCERCASGSFGDPQEPGGYCEQCNCTGNEDTTDPEFCDRLSGQCLKCIGNTGGWNCNECLEGHYGNAYHHDCRPCGCSPVGAESSLCEAATGLCECKQNYTGRNCDRCVDGYGNVELGCVPCDCNMTGSTARRCDPVSGQCPCKAGVFGLKCDTCLEGYYSYSDSGCRWCGCDVNGVLSIQCDDPTGQCVCKPFVTERTCNKCETGYWNLLSGKGCEECNCNATGSTSPLCDELYGQCSCHPGVGGNKCEICLPGYYGFSDSGCKKCEPCKSTGHICDSITGVCVCPPNTEGEYCERCTTSSWGYDALHGCKPCNCNWQGSPSDICDVDNGNCLCLEGYEGRRCDKCRFAHYQFPICRKCECRHDGSEPSQCTAEGHCQCDDNGQCPCKANVDGVKCDSCKPGTFGMTVENPKGCFECFCFGRADKCNQAQMVWSQVTMPSRDVQFELGDTPLATLHNFLLIPGHTGNVKLGIPYILDQPLYWILPREFLGEKTASYNGILQFHIESRSSRRFPDPLLLKYPLLLLQGNHRIVLVHSPFLPISGGRYNVRLHEDEWRQLENPQVPVSRMMLMVALQNVQYILVRATEGADVKISRLSDVSLEVAVPLSPTPASPYVAVGVELCHCPSEYNGNSCQDPGRGYYRKRKPNFLDSKDIIDLIGYPVPCPCNNRSNICEPETGYCLNCKENTAGAFCDICAKGFYGDPSLVPCLPCACPLVTNSFSDTCEGDILDHVCTNCQQGYEGKNCEKCSRGYYGNPTVPGDFCKPCECNPYGSLDRICDRMTGQCYCRRGITGRDCTQCKTRHILTEVGCKSCEDKCIGPLLDDVDFLTDMVAKSNVSNFVAAPWIPLLALDNQTYELQKNIMKYRETLIIGGNISQHFIEQFDFETLVDLMYLRARDMNIRAPPLAFQAHEIKEDAETLLKELDKSWKNVYDAVYRLQNNGNKFNISRKNLEKKIIIAEKILEEIKRRILSERREEAERELRKAHQILDEVKNVLMDQQLFSDKKDKLDHLSYVLSEAIRLIEKRVRQTSMLSTAVLEASRDSEQAIRDKIALSEKTEVMTNVTLLDAVQLLDQAEVFIANASVTLQQLLPLQTALENSTEQLEYHRGILARLNPRYIPKFVVPAKEHADHMTKQALYLIDATRIASQFPLQAAKVYQDIMDILDAAEQIALNTFGAADRAHYEAHPDRDDSLTKQAYLVKKHSQKLHEEAMEHKLDIQALQDSLEKKKKTLEKIALDIMNGISVLNDFTDEIDLLPRDIADKLLDIEEEHKSTKNKMAYVHSSVDKLVYMINQELYPKLEHLRVGSPAGLSNITKIIEIAKSTTQKAANRANGAENRVERVKQLNNQMQFSLKNLKNKIILARQKASSIRVSMSADRAGICVRSYKPDIEPTSTSSIVLNYAINTDATDSLLFFLASSTSEDFMIVEMVDRKIRFLWNAGGGTQVIQHNLTIQTNDQQFLKNQHWYKIEINRFGNIATLSVKSTPDGQKADPYEVTDASPAGFSKMDLDSNSFFYIGGTPKGYRVPRELKARNFAGCLYEVVLDGKPVGLWNFITSQGCDGCKEGATEEADFGAYRFKGDGYAILPQIKRYNKYSYVVTLRFKTFDEDSLIFFAPSLQTDDFVSLELRGGHVMYQFNLGRQSRSVLKTAKKYNTGNWTRLAAVREKLQGQLSVEEELLEGQLPAGAPTVLELQKSLLYYGGVSPNFTTSNWGGITFQKFLGCMKDLQIDTTPLDLLQNDSYGVEASCRDVPIKVVSFRGSGYLEMNGQPLAQESNFGFSFKSTQDTAVLMLSTFDTGKNVDIRGENVGIRKQDYYSVALVGGHLEARFYGGSVVANGSGVAKITSSVLVNDGNYHTVTFLKRHRKIVMRVDDVEVGEGRLPKGSKDIGAPSKGGLFFGGFREGIFADPMIATKVSLIGTIKDAVFNDRLLHFNEPADFVGAGIGRSQKDWFGTEEPYTGITQPLERCAEMASYILEKRAVKFGDELFSYAKLTVRRKDIVHDFNVTFEFRTYYPYGLISLLKNGRGLSHFAIMLLGSRIVIDVHDRKQRRITSHGPLSDGNWHNVTVTKTGRRLVLRVDAQKKSLKTKVRRRLALRSPLYVGGVPEEMESIDKVVLESFKGCIKNFHLNDKYMDLASGELHSVGHCFSTIEPGAYFAGDAYAIYERNFDLGVILDIQMEFKTTKRNGVLLSLSDSSGVPSLALELYNGSVIVSVDLGDGEGAFSAIRTFQSKYEMCDGRWHMVTAQYDHKAVTLKVDMFDVSYGLSENIPLKPQTSSPLYIGGLPDDAPQGALHIRDSFVGCLRNIAISDRRVDWIDMAARHNVLPNSCPTF